METKYRLAIVPTIEWDVKVKVDQVEKGGKMFASASFFRETDTANVAVSVYGFKVSLTAKPVDAKVNELFIMTYAIDRARDIASSFTGYDLPLMLGFPADVVERSPEDVENPEEVKEPTNEPAPDSEKNDAPVS